MKMITKHFRDITEKQIALFNALPAIYADKNEKVNLISRADIPNLCPKHIFHSLSIAKFISFKPGTKVLDLGTGGGFPGIPLAIYFPEVQFCLVDSIGKKINMVNEIIQELDLKNCVTMHSRAENVQVEVDFVVCRAVAKIEKLLLWSNLLISNKHQNAIPNGLIALKGGNLKEELATAKVDNIAEVHSINALFNVDFFEEKYIVYIPY